jgi:hypothetical protein
MLTAPTARARSIEEVPALLVMLLNDAGKLPPIPNEPRPITPGFRTPDLCDMEAVRWLASWESPRVDRDGYRKVAGLATFSDDFDWHNSANVRRIHALRGSKRASIELVRWLIADAAEKEMRLVGSPAKDDFALIHAMERIGGVITRRWMETVA